MKRTLLLSLVGLHFMYKMNVSHNSFTLLLKLSHKEEKQMTHTYRLIQADNFNGCHKVKQKQTEKEEKIRLYVLKASVL